MSRSYPGIAPDDPLKPLLDGMAERDEAMTANVAALAEAIKGVAVLPPGGLAKLGEAAASGAHRGTMALARAHNRRTLLLYAGATMAIALTAAAAGFWGGWTAQGARVQETERHLATAFLDGPSNAAAWLGLMENNDIVRAMAYCTGPRAYADQDGRKICLLPLYVEPPRRSAPTEAQR